MMTTAEEMALAVLKGDLDAARMLADLLLENQLGATRSIPPIKKIPCERNRLRVVVLMDNDIRDIPYVNGVSIQTAVDRWLDGVGALLLVGVKSVELYELPESFYPPRSDQSLPVTGVTQDRPTLSGQVNSPTERLQTVYPTGGITYCNARPPNDHTILCGLPAGHGGDHSWAYRTWG